MLNMGKSYPTRTFRMRSARKDEGFVLVLFAEERVVLAKTGQ